MSALVGRRIIGPQKVRLLNVIPDADADNLRRGGKKKGVLTGGYIGHTVAGQLLVSGWKLYDGPARAIDGWIQHPSGDPDIRPNPLLHPEWRPRR